MADSMVRPASLTSEFIQNYENAPKTKGSWSDINPPHYDPAVGYKLISPVDPRRTPFSLYLNGWLEMRYFGFARSKETAIDQTGAVVPIENTNYVGFPRNQIRFSGFIAVQTSSTVWGFTARHRVASSQLPRASLVTTSAKL